jgi:ADP-heptose:LPS heptosyltransferase
MLIELKAKVTRRKKRTVERLTHSFQNLINGVVSLVTEKYWLLDLLPQAQKPVHTVLLVRLDLLGDFVIWLDAAKEFRKIFPNSKITLYANNAWLDLARDLPYWDEVVGADVPRLRSDPVYRLITLLKIRRRGFGAAIQTTYSREYIGDLLVRASNASVRIGQFGDTNNIYPEKKEISDAWYSKLIANEPNSKTEYEFNRDFIRGLGSANFVSQAPRIDKQWTLPPTLSFKEPYCLIFPGASWAHKIWPAENFALLAEHLSSQYGLRILVCGTVSEYSICELVVQTAKTPVINLAGKTPLTMMVQLIRQSALVVANDSASVHIAAAVCTPAVCVLGGGHFGRFLPYSNASQSEAPLPVSVYERMPCYGCRWQCHYPLASARAVPCIENVSVERVIQACAQSIAIKATVGSPFKMEHCEHNKKP